MPIVLVWPLNSLVEPRVGVVSSGLCRCYFFSGKVSELISCSKKLFALFFPKNCCFLSKWLNPMLGFLGMPLGWVELSGSQPRCIVQALRYNHLISRMLVVSGACFYRRCLIHTDRRFGNEVHALGFQYLWWAWSESPLC